jgi:CheY-like chemotaxis protein
LQPSLRILALDDEVDIANSIKIGLEHRGFQVDAFTDPAQALSRYVRRRYDMLLVDVRMPGMSGFEFVKAVRSIDPGVQFCLLTAFDVQRNEFTQNFPHDDPTSHLLRKPMTLSVLSTALSQLIDDHKKGEHPPA